MPIYAYKCESCGHAKDVLQKISDAPLTDCPQCGASSFKKQVTAASFQLKGDSPAQASKSADTEAARPAGTDNKAADTAAASAPAATAPAPASAAPASKGSSGDSSSKASS
jgi:putative FmdB family regulatory protein